MDRRDFQGRQIDVVFAQERRKSSDQMRSRDGPYPVRSVPCNVFVKDFFKFHCFMNCDELGGYFIRDKSLHVCAFCMVFGGSALRTSDERASPKLTRSSELIVG